MKDITVILVKPKFPGNVGAVARAMSNFNVHKLIIVGSKDICAEMRNRAKHANFLLDGALWCEELDEAIGHTDINIGTTGIINTRQTGHIRNPLTPDQLFEKISSGPEDGSIGLVFGREDTGLLDDELMKMDILLSIPTSREYPVMNLSHAVCIVLWEFHRRGRIPKKYIRSLKDTGEVEREKMVETFCELMDEINYPPHRKDKTMVLFRRMLGRSVPTNWEYHTIMGVLGGAVRKFRRDRKE